ncbi:S8 family serine peptidase [Mucilaginibacter sp. PAMB04168]|uniref:S8 family peptidase n=1 Tax=Mucilaginibacter sp. PAMB04168 TaxID=3138567 RepID=UPI0031F63D51
MKNGMETNGVHEEVEYTGRYLILLPDKNSENHVKSLNEASGLNLLSSTEFENEIFTEEDLAGSDGIVLDKLGIAIVNSVPDQLMGISALGTDENPVIVEPERVVYAFGNNLNQNYLKGYVDAVNNMASELLLEEETESDGESTVESVGSTWGLQATNVIPTILLRKYSGQGIKVAVLDTGFEFNHPDFAGRNIIQQSFVSGQTSADGHGHGTHCIGTSCGPLNVVNSPQPRYGIAYNASICVGKVLSNAGSGADGGILAGINWAVSQGCAVISMSLGAPTNASAYSAIFETAAARALSLGSLIVAAAGNDSNRAGGAIKPVSHPANCPSIMAVGALDSNMKVANFSNGGIFTPQGSVDISGPGVGVFSSTKLPTKYATMNGTSMATPHVAGIAALWAESAGVRGAALWNKLIQTAKRLNLPARDVGAGLVQAPSKSILVPTPIFTPKLPHNLEEA